MSLGIFQSVGVWEVLLLLLVLLLVFGPKRLPEMGRSLGRGMREFKDSISGNDLNFDEENEETAAAIAQPTTVAPAQPAPVAATPQPAEPAPAPVAAPAEPAPAPAPVAAPAEQAPSGTEQSS